MTFFSFSFRQLSSCLRETSVRCSREGWGYVFQGSNPSRSMFCGSGSVWEVTCILPKEMKEKRGGSWARWIHPRGTLCHAGCLLATPLAQTTTQGTSPPPPPTSACPESSMRSWRQRRKERRKKTRHFNISNVAFDLSIILHSLGFSLFSFDLAFYQLNFSFALASTKEMHITVTNFRCGLYFFSFYDIPSCHVLSGFLLFTIHPYFIPDTVLRFASHP